MPDALPSRPQGSPGRELILSDILADVFRGELDTAGVLDLVVASARRALGADRASCYVRGERGERLLAVHTTEGARDLSVEGLPVWRLLSARPDPTLVLEDLSDEPAIPAATARALGAGALIGLRLQHPSVGEGAAAQLGALFVAYRRPRRFSARERATARSLAGMASIALANARLHRLRALQGIRVLARAVDARDPLTHEHSERVADLAVAIAGAMGWGLERRARLREAGLVHDVGKIGIPDRILFTPRALTPAEYGEITRHAQIGADMLGDVLAAEQVAWVRGHHERWDGTGYPDRLAGRAIPEGARVLALADAWDVMTSGRSYHEPLTAEEALAECVRCSGTQFWDDAVGALVRLVRSGAAEVV